MVICVKFRENVMRKNFKSVTIPLAAYNEIKTLGTSQIFEVPLSVSKTIVWLLEKNKQNYNRKNGKLSDGKNSVSKV